MRTIYLIALLDCCAGGSSSLVTLHGSQPVLLHSNILMSKTAAFNIFSILCFQMRLIYRSCKSRIFIGIAENLCLYQGSQNPLLTIYKKKGRVIVGKIDINFAFVLVANCLLIYGVAFCLCGRSGFFFICTIIECPGSLILMIQSRLMQTHRKIVVMNESKIRHQFHQKLRPNV